MTDGALNVTNGALHVTNGALHVTMGVTNGALNMRCAYMTSMRGVIVCCWVLTSEIIG